MVGNQGSSIIPNSDERLQGREGSRVPEQVLAPFVGFSDPGGC